MPSVTAGGLGFAYSDRAPILCDVDFRLWSAWYGLVGANGAGKTTLVRLIAGDILPIAGRIRLEPRDARVVVCEQEVTVLSAALASFADRQDGRSHELRGILGLTRDMVDRWNVLSPGERKRWQVATAMAEEPDILIVDEPTNHLDAEARRWLLQALARFSGVGIVVSHDRELLDRLTTATLRIDQTRCVLYPAAYSEAREMWLLTARRAEVVREAAKERVSNLRRRIADAGRERQAAEKNRGTRARMRNLDDSDARTIGAANKAEWAEAGMGRRITVMSRQLARLEGEVEEFVVDKTVGRSLFVDYAPAPRPRLLALSGVDVTRGDRVLVRDAHVVFERRDRVHLRGPNGSGKTTLLDDLLAAAAGGRRGEVGPQRTGENDHILYLPQELDAGQILALRRSVDDLSRIARGRILSLLAALGVDPDRLLASQRLSPGEARKLKVAFGLASHAWALVLDEPTNHLDLPSIERLEAMLASFPGALLVVSHDEHFARRITDTVWQIENGRLVCASQGG